MSALDIICHDNSLWRKPPYWTIVVQALSSQEGFLEQLTS
jgi:hypothetical protein